MTALDQLSVQLDGEALNAIVTKAILDQITAEQRKVILDQAVKALLSPKPDPYGYSRREITPVQAAFDNAVRQSAMKAAQTLVDDDVEFQGRLRNMVRDSMTKLLDSESDLAQAVGTAVGQAVTAWAQENRR